MTKHPNLLDIWPELLAGGLAIIGFFIGISSNNTLVSIITALCIGTLGARIIVTKLSEQPIGPFYSIIIALAIGFILGSFFVSRILMTTLIIGSFILSYYLHKKKIIQTFKSKAFLK